MTDTARDNGSLRDRSVLDAQLANAVGIEIGFGCPTLLQNIRTLLESGADAAFLTEDKRLKIFHAAMMNGHTEVALAMIESGADVSKIPKGFVQPAFFTIVYQFTENIWQAIVQSGANLAAKNERKWSLLHLACSSGCHAVVQKLINQSVPLEHQTSDGFTPMHLASNGGHGAICRALVSHGANPNAPASDGQTPLFTAAGSGHIDCCLTLMELGANSFLMHKGKSVWAHANAKGEKQTGLQLKGAMASMKASRAIDVAMGLHAGAPTPL